VAVGKSGVFAAGASGEWSTFALETGAALASADGPAPLHAVWHDSHMIAAVGPEGVATAPADLATPPTITAGLDARAVAAWTDRVAVAHPLGVSLLSMSDEGDLVPLSTWSASETQHATGIARTADGRLVVAVMGLGLAVLTTQSDALVEASTLTFAPRGLPMAVAVRENLAAVADWDRVRLIDIASPAPVALAREPFPVRSPDGARALGIATTQSGFATLGLDHATALTVHPDQPSAELALHPKWPYLSATEEAGGAAAVLITNTGREDLEIDQIDLGSDRLTLTNDLPLTVTPDGLEVLDLLVSGGDPLDTQAVLKTNDPDRPEFVLPISVNPDILQPGDQAPDFIVPTTAGELASLSDYLGSAVYLRLFNSQCESCLKELPVIEADFWQVYKTQGFVAAGLHLGDNLATAISFERQTGITFPVLLDQDLDVLRLYTRVGHTQYLFPLVYLLDPDGVVQQVYTDEEVEHSALTEAVEAVLP